MTDDIGYWRNRLENAMKDMIRISSIRDGYANNCIMNARSIMADDTATVDDIRDLTIVLDSYVLYLVQHSD